MDPFYHSLAGLEEHLQAHAKFVLRFYHSFLGLPIVWPHCALYAT